MKTLKTILIGIFSGLLLTGATLAQQPIQPQYTLHAQTLQLQRKAANRNAFAKPMVLHQPQISVRVEEMPAAATQPAAAQTPRAGRKNASKDVAYLTVEVKNDAYGQGCGYQVFLDKDCNTADYFYNKYTYTDKDLSYDDYFEYAIPAEALSQDMWASLKAGQEQTIEVTPDNYDLVIVYADKAEFQLFFVLAVADRFDFNAGCRYVVTIQNHSPSFRQYIPYDLGLGRITSHGETAGSLSAEEALSLKVYNNGMADVNAYSLTCKVDDSEPFTENVTTKLAAGYSIEYTFTHKVDLSAKGEHKICIFATPEEHDYVSMNDTLYASIWNVDAIEEPFTTGFDTSLKLHWIVQDANEDGRSWAIHIDRDESGTTGKRWANIYTYRDITPGQTEALITRYPLHMKKGTHHIVYKDWAVPGWDDKYDVLIGKKSMPATMEKLVTKTVSAKDYNFSLQCVNFEVEEEGDYYVAFNAYGDPDGFSIGIDDVEIGEGEFVTPPDLQVEAVLTPGSACGLTDAETLKVRIGNYGYSNVTKVGVRGTVNGTAFEKTVNVNIPIMTAKDVTLTQIDLSQEGTVYHLDFTVFVPEDGCSVAEEDTTNNHGSAVVYHWAPVNTPFISSFKEEDDASWNDWSYGDGIAYRRPFGMYVNTSDPIISRCINLKADTKYRLTVKLMAGGASLTQQYTEDLQIKYGKTGSRITSWKTAANLTELYTNDVFTEYEFEFTCAEAGIYSFAMICPSAMGTLYIKQFSLKEILDYDITLSQFGPLPVTLPADHVNGSYVLPVVLKNSGNQGIAQAKVTVELNGAAIGEETVSAINAGDAVRKEVNVSVEGIGINEELTLTATASITGREAEDVNNDNSLSAKVTVSDEVLAYDVATEDLCFDEKGLLGGYNGLALTCAQAVYFNKKDTLTAVSILLGEGETYETTLSIYGFDPDNESLGSLIYSSKERVSGRAGNEVFTVPSLMLERGYYIISIVIEGYILVVDDNLDGTFYILDGGWAYPQTGYGIPALRAVFGHDGVPYAKDADVMTISKPKDAGPFGENQPVAAILRNNGYERIQTTVSLKVDGVKTDEKNIFLNAYQVAEVNFTADLSAIGRHVITVSAESEGDENPDNNSMEKTVETVAPANPYVMNFEQCDDWAVSEFNPLWRTVDGDGKQTGGFTDLKFPHMLEPYAFIAFNPSLLEFGEGAALAIAPYDGQRLGVAFYNLRREQNDDWLISPALTLPAENAWMSLQVKTYIDYRGLESYQILISESGELNDFKVIKEGEAPDDAWEKIRVDLNAYAGKTVYVAVRCVSENKFVFMVDDIRISDPLSTNNSPLAAQLSLYPNPARQVITIKSTDARLQEVVIYNVSGREVYRSNVAKSAADGYFRYNVSGLAQGMYFARVVTSQGTTVLKFVVE